MRVTCSWCNLDMGEKEPFDDPSVSHGMCAECKRSVEAEIEAYFTLNPPAKQEGGTCGTG